MVPAKELVASIAKDEECIVSGNIVFQSSRYFILIFCSGAKIHARPIADQRT